MEDLWTNRNSLGDFVINGMTQNYEDCSNVLIAAAFFTEDDVVKQFAEHCLVRMVVRLGYPTNPQALKAIVNHKNIELRYYTDNSFHPKLYIFGSNVAFVGSANLTRSALTSNQEVVVSINSDDPRFNELVSLFSDYWTCAQVLTPGIIDAYQKIYSRSTRERRVISEIDKETQQRIGKVVFGNIERENQVRAKERIYLEDYQKVYQECVTAFNRIRDVYISVGKRRNNSSDIPMRLEIDAFISFVRETYAIGDSWKHQAIGWTEGKKLLVKEHISEWLVADNHITRYFDEGLSQSYSIIGRTLGSKNSIDSATYDDILEALAVLHSFYERKRFFLGGFDTLVRTFKKENEIDDTKLSLEYLLFGEDPIIERMANLIYDNEYKLRNFGQSNVQELIGYLNDQDLPVVNGRTTKVFRFYGFDVGQPYEY